MSITTRLDAGNAPYDYETIIGTASKPAVIDNQSTTQVSTGGGAPVTQTTTTSKMGKEVYQP